VKQTESNSALQDEVTIGIFKNVVEKNIMKKLITKKQRRLERPKAKLDSPLS
jgi:hypothetical protein